MTTRTGYEIPYLSQYDDAQTAQYTFTFANISTARTVTVPDGDVNLTFLEGVVAGTASASRALILGATKNIDTIDITLSGLKIGGVAVDTSAAELNFLDNVVAGTASASKALVLGATKNIDTIDIATSGLKINAVIVSSDAAELNFLDGSIAGTAVASKALVLGASKNVDTLVVDGALSVGSLTVGGVATALMVMFDVTIGFADLAAAGTKILIDASAGQQYELVDMFISADGTAWNVGGNRQINIQDSSGTVIYSTIPRLALTSLTASRWGQSTDCPFPATASHFFAATTAGEDLVAKYTGGTTDYTAGALNVRVLARKV